MVSYIHLIGEATIAFGQPSYVVSEGSVPGTVEVCIVITGIPAGGLGCDITVDIDLLPGTVASKYQRIVTVYFSIVV